METPLPEVAIAPAIGATLHEMILNADPVVKAVMALLVLASILCWAIILEKAIRLALFGGQVRRFERLADAPGLSADRSAWLAAALVNAAQRQDFGPQESRIEREARIEKALRLTARRELARLQPRMRFLATVGSTAPFVGLFGTVWGIMNSFTAIAAQKDTSLAVVAPGIAEALFATALGLAAAIPAVIAYNQISGALSRTGERMTFAIALFAETVLRRTPIYRSCILVQPRGGSLVMSYDSENDTREHIAEVAARLQTVCSLLQARAERHDASKLIDPEKPAFDALGTRLRDLTYGTPEYREALTSVAPALLHHYSNNSHHPEYYPEGVAGMDLIDIVEMYCDWAAAALRTKDGSLADSIAINIERFGISGPLAAILRNTWTRHGGFRGEPASNERLFGQAAPEHP